MKLNTTTREEMWAKQHLSATDIDYAVWERDKSMLHQLSKMGRNCTFVVDVYKCKYAYASPNFVDLLGYDSHKIETLERQGDYLESRIHPDDRAQLAALQVTLSQFIYSLPFEQRNSYSNIYSFRMLNAKQQYIYNPQIQISAESETKRSIFREKDKTKRSKKESAQHSKSRNKSFVMTSVSAL